MYILHGIPDWGSQVIRMALEELGAPYRFAEVDWQAGGLTTPDFLALNPFARIPVLETPDGTMFETAAILQYLSERHGQLAPPPGDTERAGFLVWFTFITNQLHPTTMTLVHPHRPGGEACRRPVAEATHTLLREQLAALERSAATGPWWLSPDHPSIASLYVLMLLRWIRAYPAYPDHSIPLANYPALRAMAEGLERRPAVRRVLQAEAITDAAPFSDPPPPASAETA
ncbi:glutathione S-transferase family protein [Frigidibacter sp. SD6-1]|uniref:glutathione S-transferase family protein n=1 Tax=Frigidibacter sp. SD6-1 TaxID=3032581 RepID=UPI0024DFA03B|nr:glutathione S-transferase family protein [Frigidibacter sp. SD6-1]